MVIYVGHGSSRTLLLLVHNEVPDLDLFSDVEGESSDGTDANENGVQIERARVRSRFRHYKQRSNIPVPIGIFWDIENCQVSFNIY